MVPAILALIPLALAISLPLTALMRALGHRVRALDAAGVPGQVKFAPRRVPNTGGVAIFVALITPMVFGAVLLSVITASTPETSAFAWLFRLVPTLKPHLPGISQQLPHLFILLGALLVLHVMGLIDDRKPLPAYPKLLAMLALAAAVSIGTGSRLLTLVDPHVGGPWLSYLITILWMVVITNAFNFLDNMDGLSAGVAAIASTFFLVAALVNGQWFIAACLALLDGALLGFLFFNFPWKGPATIFMGDAGSLVVGFLLAFLTVRTTYVSADGGAAGIGSGWYGVFMPLVVLAIPLYDFTSVTIIRLSQGKSPFVGDLQHFSHRLVQRGLSRRAAVIVIHGFTAVTAIAGISLASLKPWQAALVGIQTLLVLMVLAMWEWSAVRQSRRTGETVGAPK
jgi:UDP-GlcNAc:undecaprenyl-phosphate GlcNAc-1-phosphate transferase